MHKNIFECVNKLEKFISNERYKGYDPYDGLMSPIFRLPLLNSNKKIRFYSQQLLKKSPVNIRPLLGIRKGYNPVTFGLCIQAYTCLLENPEIEEEEHWKSKINFLINELLRLSSKNYDGMCWGYDFHWEARHASNPPFFPTVVATGIITNALFEYYRYSGDKNIFGIVESSCAFVMKNLNRYYEGEKFCFSYSPADNQTVYNATMKAARLLSQVYSVNGDKTLLTAAKNTVGFVISKQRENGSWGYSQGDKREWSDNFHTGYILDCLDEYIKNSHDNTCVPNLQKGLEYYLNNFFNVQPAGDNTKLMPKYYNDAVYPADSTAVAQSILTLCRFGLHDKADEVVNWALDNMYDRKGYFFYRIYKYHKDKTSYMRWSNAWMFLALSFFIKSHKNTNNLDLV